MNNKEIYLEPLPGINIEEEKKEEVKVSSNQQLPLETTKTQPPAGSTTEKKDSDPIIDPEAIQKFKGKMLKEKSRYRRYSSNCLSPSPLFLWPFAIIDEKETFQEEDESIRLEDKSFNHKKSTYDESSDLDNTKKLFAYNKAEKNPVKEGLLNRIEQLQRNQREIDIQFKHDSEIYLKKIRALEKACQANSDETKLKNLEKTNKKNKDLIRQYQKYIEQAEKEKIKDKKDFYDALNGIIELKSTLLSELKELEILAKNTSFQDYDEYLKENPTKIEKLNFRPNDSKYLLTNEYETSREEEESYSSYEKLNHINNTPEGFDISKRNNSLSKTEQYFYNTKNFVGTVGSNNNNSFNNNNKVNHSFILNNKKNNLQDIDKYSFKKNDTLNDIKNRKSINDMSNRDSKIKKNTNKNLSNFINNNHGNQNLNNSQKRINPSDIMNRFPQDPDFINNDMILIRDMGKEDTFY